MYDPDKECKVMIANLKKFCNQRGITPHALAKEAGISTSTISYLMTGKTRPQVYTILLFCNVLDVKMSDLFDHKKVESSTKEQEYMEMNILASYRNLSNEKKKLLKLYMDMLEKYDSELLGM